MNLKVQPGIMEISPYVGGKSDVAGVANTVKLSSNENPYGPPPSAMEAYARVARELHRYPSTDHAPLRAAIAEVHGLDASRIICGVGSDEVLQFVTQCYSGPGDEVIHTEHGFSMYPLLAHAAGATPVKVPERDRVVDVDAILNAVTDRTRIVFLTNPGNPTSTMIDEAEVRRLAAGLRDDIILVIDGAYAEYIEGFDGGAGVVDDHPNAIMTRTFSKIYGLGGLRVGWGYAHPEVIDVLNRVRQPFNLSNGQMAAAEAALRDTDWLVRCRDENARLRHWLAQALAERGVASDTSMTNFILSRFADAQEAADCNEYLAAQGLLVRPVAGYGLPHCLRITIGDEPACRQVAHAIGQFKAGARAGSKAERAEA